MERHFTVSGFVVEPGRTLLHWHRKSGMWLPPGGHVERGEDPVQAVLREVLEETGITAEVLATPPTMDFEVPQQLPAPYTILIEDIPEGPHQHIDLIYFVRPVAGSVRAAPADDPFIWVTAEELRRDEPLPVASCGVDLPVPADVRALGLVAISALVERG